MSYFELVPNSALTKAMSSLMYGLLKSNLTWAAL